MSDISDFVTLHPYFSVFLVVMIFLAIESFTSVFYSKDIDILGERIKQLEDNDKLLNEKRKK